MGNKSFCKATMVLALAVFGGGLVLESSRVRGRDENKDARPLGVAQQLEKVVSIGAWDDPKTSLADALDLMQKLSDLTFVVNTRAFETEELKEVEKYEIVASKPIPEMKASIRRRLETVLGRLPVASGAIWVIRDKTIEITTTAAFRKELGREDDERLLPLTHAIFEKRPLEDALKQLADQTDFSVVLDSRAGDKAKVLVSATLKNVPLDTAVRLLADMAELEPVLQDNVLYITTRENAARIEKEKSKRKGLLPGM
jgi:hypothetical protein